MQTESFAEDTNQRQISSQISNTPQDIGLPRTVLHIQSSADRPRNWSSVSRLYSANVLLGQMQQRRGKSFSQIFSLNKQKGNEIRSNVDYSFDWHRYPIIVSLTSAHFTTFACTTTLKKDYLSSTIAMLVRQNIFATMRRW